MGKGDRKKHKKKKKKYIKDSPQKRNEKSVKIEELKNKKNENIEKSEGGKMSYEIAREKLEYNQENPVHFLKFSAKYNILDGDKVKDMNDFKKCFTFANYDDKTNKKFKNLKNTEFALEWFKEYKFEKENNIKYFKINKKDLETIKSLIKIPNVATLIPYSFILYGKIKLQSPYFSKDDDEFYLIQNPCLKDKAFKVPMARGSGWKGAIAKAGKDLINEDFSWFSSYVRIFGTGSEEYGKLIEGLEKNKGITKILIKYLLFELGKKLTKDDIETIKNNPQDYLKNLNKNFTKQDIGKTMFLNIHRGRAIFYPTFFDTLSLEIINPHSRKTRAGTNPIHYEVVPENTEGILQIVYIPHDGILTENSKLKEEVEKDIYFLTKCIEKTAKNGIGAKTKLGWGRFEIIKIRIERKEGESD